MSTSILRGVVLVIFCIIHTLSQGTGSIVYVSKKGLYAVLVDGSQQVRTLYEFPASEVHEDICGLVVDSQLGLVLWAETFEQPTFEAILWKISLNPVGGEKPKKVASYTSISARVYGLTIDETTKSAYMTFFMSIGVDMFKLDNYDTADNVALSKSTNSHSGRRVSGPVTGFSPVFANGEVYESGREDRNDYCDLLRVSPNLQAPVPLVQPRALQWEEMCGPIVFSKLDNLIYYAMGDDLNDNHLVRADPTDTKPAEQMMNVDIPEFLHDRPAVFYTGAAWPNIAPIGDAAGWLATNSVSEIFLWDLTDPAAPVKTKIYTGLTSEGDLGPITWAGDVPPQTESPTKAPTAVPTSSPINMTTGVPTEVPTMQPATNSTTDSPTGAPSNNMTTAPTSAPGGATNSTQAPTVVPPTPSPAAAVSTQVPGANSAPTPQPPSDDGML